MKTDCSQDKFLELGVLYKQYSAVNKPPQIIVNFCHPLWIDYWMCDRPSIVSELKWKAMGLQVYAENCNTGTCEPCPDPVECDSCCPPVEDCEPCDPCPDPVDCDSCCPPPEDCDSCCPDCDPCDPCDPCDSCCEDPPDPFCGDGNCDPGETCETCPQDCGQCPEPPPPGSCGEPLDLEVAWTLEQWLDAALQALGSIAAGDVADVSTPGGTTSLFAPCPEGSVNLDDVFAGDPEDPDCKKADALTEEEQLLLYPWWDKDLWPDPCVASWEAEAHIQMEPELPWEMIRTDWVQLLVWEVAHPDGLPVIVSSKLLSLSNLTAAGKICVWNYFWACRMAYAHMVADDYVAIKFDTQQWITSLNLEGIEAFVSFP